MLNQANTQVPLKRCKKSDKKFPSRVSRVRKKMNECKTCVQDKGNDNAEFTPELINKNECVLDPENVMQIDLLPKLPPNGGYQKHHCSDWYILKIRFRIPGIQHYSRQRSGSYHQYYNKTCVSTYHNDNWQRLSFCLKWDTRKGWHPLYDTPKCKHETCTNYRSFRKNSCHNKVVTENLLGGNSQTKAQIFTTSHFKLQHNVWHKNQMCT